MDVVIRNALVSDASKLNSLLTLLIHDEKKYDTNINGDYVVNEYYENVLGLDTTVAFVAIVNNEIIGYIYGYIIDNDAYVDKLAVLDALYVTNGYRGLKIGTRLIDIFKEWTNGFGVKYIEVKVLNENKIAYKLYEKLGFNKLKTIMVMTTDK